VGTRIGDALAGTEGRKEGQQGGTYIDRIIISPSSSAAIAAIPLSDTTMLLRLVRVLSTVTKRMGRSRSPLRSGGSAISSAKAFNRINLPNFIFRIPFSSARPLINWDDNPGFLFWDAASSRVSPLSL